MIEVLQHHTVVRDGWHNHNTEIIYWNNHYYLAYRRSSGHYSFDTDVILMRSVDLKRWREIAKITVGDDRDPKFCPVGNKLFMYFGTFFKLINREP